MRPASVWIAIGLVAVALLATAHWFTQSGQKAAVPASERGLRWLPADSVVVASVHVNELVQQRWLVELIEQVAPVEPDADYREFVAATGFDYARDLERLWLAATPGASGHELIGIAQGRFEQQKILAYARSHAAARVSLAGVTAYVLEEADAGSQFAFAFLDEHHLAFAERLSGVEKILACVRQATPAVMNDARRRVDLEQFAAGMHTWAVSEDVARWPPALQAREPELVAQLQRVAAGGRVSPEGIELLVHVKTREPAQAGRLKLFLEAYGLMEWVRLGRQDDPTSRALREALRGAAVSQQGNSLTVRLPLSRSVVAALLAGERPSVSAPTGARP